MTPRQIVLANIDWAGAERIGLNFNRGRINDFAGAPYGPSATYRQKRWTEGGKEYYDDAWGNLWVRMVDGSSAGEVHTPAITDWGQLDDLALPDFDDPARFVPVREAFAAESEKFRLFFVPGWVFATSRYLRKMEVYFVDLIEYPEEIDRLHEVVTDLYVRVVAQAVEAGADGVFFCEDLGVQDRLLLSPAMWRERFAPHYRRLTDAAHSGGAKVLMHSCGYNWDLLDDLAAAGIDCFQFDQPAAYDMPALAAKLRDLKVGLWAPVDIQKVLPTGDRAFIEAEARKMVETFGGGLIAKNYPDLAGIGIAEEWDDWAYQAILDAAGVTAG